MTQDSELPPQSNLPDQHPHKPADDTEEIYFQGSPLLRGEVGKLLLFWIIALVLLAIPVLFRATELYWPNWIVTLACIVLAVIMFLVPVIRTRTVRYRISNYRIDFERGLLSKSIDTLELWHVEDIALHQSLLDRILNVGSIKVISHDETTPMLEMHGLPNPRPVFDSLKQRIIAVKRQRGVIKMDMG